MMIVSHGPQPFEASFMGEAHLHNVDPMPDSACDVAAWYLVQCMWRPCVDCGEHSTHGFRRCGYCSSLHYGML